MLVSASKDGVVMLWRHTSQAQQADLLIGSITLPPATCFKAVKLSPKNNLLLIVTPNKWLVVIDLVFLTYLVVLCRERWNAVTICSTS